ncbi:RND transporter [Pseudomonas sp. Choline-3u-10]|jgi:NodT family efflux transporter outer membrane factor (OMF) lipoprotein|uniref:efflux transporter outer membrane subunit n=1 Tax=Pseudomonadaceae TaxID=135621 RepID=UPI000617E46A|nr:MULTISPECIES: efflux transporter outer membrane subunit [Pseudomonadaceae]MAL38245.1 RND transporter [Pseudomonas sp.]MBU0949915.1 efflux transporter outer membrane subunit [Gammaproteobacteria bacterium]KJJ65066.1 RND transporter [Pseudomonas sp. 10B238]MBK3795748.1 efflux transporter outer membrane subunit [Stutzerimonas stutzeri]MBK3877897.1 efflux transporter outer membrane subunit [Stutzerimonas stutzeri]
MSSLSLKNALRPLAIVVMTFSLGACTLGPDYQRPELPMAAEFKRAEGWKVANPADVLERGSWWRLYGDAKLDALVERLNVSNQNLAAAEAQYRQARALVRGARSQLFPTVGGSAGATRAGQGSSTSSAAQSASGFSGISESYSVGLDAAWELDIWGRLRRNLEANRANMQATAADLAAVRLSLQSELVQTYLQLRVMDEQQRLLNQTVEAFARSLRLTENQYRAGIVPKSDVTQALTQLRSTEAQAIDLQWQRAQMEHAIAVLIGVPPSELDIEERDEIPDLPAVPLALPSQLLERRPDIASAERQVIAANAQIGVAEAAWYPDLTLSASGGYRNSSFSDLISLPNRFWSLGPQLAATLLDFGGRRADLEAAETNYDLTVANYRQTVLDSFREVEDNLVQLRVLAAEAVVQRQALEAAQESLRLIQNQYRAGTVDFLSVATVQTSALNNERTYLTLLGDQLAASVQLIAALGGGWEEAQLDFEPLLETPER